MQVFLFQCLCKRKNNGHDRVTVVLNTDTQHWKFQIFQDKPKDFSVEFWYFGALESPRTCV